MDCVKCVCLARGGLGGEWVRGLSVGFNNPVGTVGSTKIMNNPGPDMT